jgi:hypothetical protein
MRSTARIRVSTRETSHNALIHTSLVDGANESRDGDCETVSGDCPLGNRWSATSSARRSALCSVEFGRRFDSESKRKLVTTAENRPACVHNYIRKLIYNGTTDTHKDKLHINRAIPCLEKIPVFVRRLFYITLPEW